MPYEGKDEPIIFSYHYKYEKYLRDNNLIDPEKAKVAAQRAKRTQQLNNDKNKVSEKLVEPLQGEDLSGDNDDSYPGAMDGKYRFD